MLLEVNFLGRAEQSCKLFASIIVFTVKHICLRFSFVNIGIKSLYFSFACTFRHSIPKRQLCFQNIILIAYHRISWSSG
jgi:hypothetical protein